MPSQRIGPDIPVILSKLFIIVGSSRFRFVRWHVPNFNLFFITICLRLAKKYLLFCVYKYHKYG